MPPPTTTRPRGANTTLTTLLVRGRHSESVRRVPVLAKRFHFATDHGHDDPSFRGDPQRRIPFRSDGNDERRHGEYCKRTVIEEVNYGIVEASGFGSISVSAALEFTMTRGEGP